MVTSTLDIEQQQHNAQDENNNNIADSQDQTENENTKKNINNNSGDDNVVNGEQKLDETVNMNIDGNVNTVDTTPPQVKRKRGRPPKNQAGVTTSATDNNNGTTATPTGNKKSIKIHIKNTSTSSSPNLKYSFDQIQSRLNESSNELNPNACPICKCIIEQDQFEQHYTLELKKLEKIGSVEEEEQENQPPTTLLQKTPKRASSINALMKTHLSQSTSNRGASGKNQGTERTFESINGSLDAIRSKREKRTNSSYRASTQNTPSMSGSPVFSSSPSLPSTPNRPHNNCFVCGRVIYGDINEFNIHLDNCLLESGGLELSSTTTTNNQNNRKRKNQEDQVNSQQQQQEVYEETEGEMYEICGQLRIKKSSLIDVQMFVDSGIKSKPIDQDEEVDILQDDTAVYGQTQYTEDDLRKRKQQQQQEKEKEKEQEKENVNNVNNNINNEPTTTTTTTTTSTNNSNLMAKSGGNNFIIDALKQKIKDQEAMLKNVPNCLVCMSQYTIPLTSIKCWHVHCEQCWLDTLKVKKWCPQCNFLTTPDDLRKIYL